MAYRIDYGGSPPISKPQSRLRLRTMTAAFFLLFVLLVRSRWPDGTEKLRHALLPGTQRETQTAFDTLLGDLRTGQPLQEALHAFCQQLVDDAASQ